MNKMKRFGILILLLLATSLAAAAVATVITAAQAPADYYIWPAYERQPDGSFITVSRWEVYEPKEGDLILTTGVPSVSTRIIQERTGSLITHAAVVVRDPDNPTKLVVLDVTLVNGVRLNGIPQFLNDSALQTAYVKQLKKPLTPEQIKAMTEFARKHKKEPFMDICQFFKLGSPETRDEAYAKARAEGKWICSALAASVCQAAGLLLDIDLAKKTLLPKDLWELSPETGPWLLPKIIKPARPSKPSFPRF